MGGGNEHNEDIADKETLFCITNLCRDSPPEFITQFRLYNLLLCSKSLLQDGINDPPSISCISRLLRGSERLPRDDDARKDYSIHGILGGKSLYLYAQSFGLLEAWPGTSHNPLWKLL